MERNYYLPVEILIVLKDSLVNGEGLPTVKDIQVPCLLLALDFYWFPIGIVESLSLVLLGSLPAGDADS